MAAPFRARRSKDNGGSGRKSKARTKAKTKAEARKGERRRKRAQRKAQPAVTGPGERNAALLTATVLGLTLFGLVMVLSASSVSSLHEFGSNSSLLQFKRQVMWAALGGILFAITSRVNYRVLRRLGGPLLLICLVLLVLVFIPGLGVNANGSSRWLELGPIVIQPSELAKMVFIIWVADLLARRERRMDHPELTVRPVMLVLVILSTLIVAQPKLGTPIIMGAVAILMLFVAGAQMRSLLSWALAAVIAATALAYLEDYRWARIVAFLDPWESPQGAGYQVIQSQVGVASGGLLGVGLGASRAKWGFVPEAPSDFIFAIVAEEVGLVGASALIGGFLLVGWCGFRSAILARDRFGTLLAAGITCWLLTQAFLNIGMVLGVMPTTGEPLPFVSAGGSSLITVLAASGLLAGISRRSN